MLRNSAFAIIYNNQQRKLYLLLLRSFDYTHYYFDLISNTSVYQHLIMSKSGWKIKKIQIEVILVVDLFLIRDFLLTDTNSLS